jgi:hypothetical protein
MGLVPFSFVCFVMSCGALLRFCNDARSVCNDFVCFVACLPPSEATLKDALAFLDRHGLMLYRLPEFAMQRPKQRLLNIATVGNFPCHGKS